MRKAFISLILLPLASLNTVGLISFGFDLEVYSWSSICAFSFVGILIAFLAIVNGNSD